MSNNSNQKNHLLPDGSIDNDNEIVIRQKHIIEISSEEIKRAIQYIRSKEDTDEELKKYKGMSDSDLRFATMRYIKEEIYNTLEKLIDRINDSHK